MNKVRQSNFELLHIVAMFMVMMLHVNFLALGRPSVEDAGSAPLATFTRILFEVMSVGSVDLFVLISGWFGIKANRKSLFTFIFQVVFVFYCISAIYLLVNKENSLEGGKIVEIITCRSWFVQAYLGLYLLSPALNLLVEKSKHLHKMVLIGWLAFEFVYDFASPDPRLFDGGYSTLHFVALYLLARYIKLYGCSNILRKYAGSLFVLVSLFVTGCMFMLIKTGHGLCHLNSYTSPFVIFLAFMLLIKTDSIHIQNNVINRIGGASFAVYLFHTHPLVLGTFFLTWAKDIYCNYSGIVYLIIITGYMIAWYIVSILIDYARQATWNAFYNKTHKFLCKERIG